MAAQNLTSVSPTLASHEFSFTVEDFDRIRDLIYRRVDISLLGCKNEMVYNRLACRLHVVNFDSFHDYSDVSGKGHLPDEWETSTNALTTSLTAFFRGQHHFPVLHEYAKAKCTPFIVWCSASSTDGEPYSITVTLAEAFGSMSPNQVSVIASDVDTNMLARTRAGIYPTKRVAALSPERLRKYFLCGTGKREDYARARPELQAMTDLRQINLLERGQPLQQKFDVIFCRDVMIYFDKPTQAKILKHFIDMMKPNGPLFANRPGNFLQITKAWSLRGETVYEVAPGSHARMEA